MNQKNEDKSAPLHSSFSLIGDSTSDHSYQQILVHDSSGVDIRAVTWNMLNKCHSISEKTPYSNNPMNINENFPQYRARKLKQFDKIVNLISQAAASGAPIDCIFLQETDWARMLNNSVDNPSGSADKVHTELSELFKKKLAALGWDFVLSPKEANTADTTQQNVLTLYNKNTLTTVANSGQGVLPAVKQGAKKRNRGYKSTFTHITSQKTVDLVNFHLDYEYNHAKDLVEVMDEAIAKDRIIVMGGDANHPPNFDIYTLTGNWNVATAIDMDKARFNADGTLEMTKHHAGVGTENINKHYDGFCAGSAQQIIIHKEAGDYFEIKNGKVTLEHGTKIPASSADELDYPTHESEAGYPWMRGRALLQYLDNKLATLVDQAQKQALLNKMGEIAKNRFNETLEQAAVHKQFPLVHIKAISVEKPEIKPEVKSEVDTLLASLPQIVTINQESLAALSNVLKRLQKGANNTTNPYYMNCSKKLKAICEALGQLPNGTNFENELNNTQSKLYKAINMKRISSITFLGDFSIGSTKSLLEIQDAIEKKNKL